MPYQGSIAVAAPGHLTGTSVRGLIGLTRSGRADVAAKGVHGWFLCADGRLALQIDHHRQQCDNPVQSLESLEFGGSVVIRRDGTILLRRQPGSSRQIYLWIGKDIIAFDDQLERLALSVTPEASFDELSILHFMWRGRALPRKTLYSGIQCLLLGEELVCKADGPVCLRKFWWPLHFGDLPEDEEELRHEVVCRLDAALRRCVRSSEHAALLLSGGVDSSLLAALGVRQGMKLSAFTVAFETSYGLNETKFAQSVANASNIPHHEVQLSLADAIQLLGEILEAPLPRAAPAVITNDGLLAAIGEQGISIALSALGADECFGGYHKMLEYLAVQVLESKDCLSTTEGVLKWPSDRLLEVPGSMFPGVAEFFTFPELRHIAQDASLLCDMLAEDQAFYRDCLNVKPSANPLELMAAHEYQFRLAELLMPAFASPKSGALPDIAYPFMDPSVYLWASALDPKHCFWHEQDAWWAKRLLRSVASDFLPEEIVMRKRQIFLAPIQHWLLNERMRSIFLEEIADSALWNFGVLRPLIREEIISGVRANDVALRSIGWQHKVWSILVLCAWINRREIAPRMGIESTDHA